ncbi:MAG: hypothetical protein AABY26_03905 [Nanoarchaeota archaeon]
MRKISIYIKLGIAFVVFLLLAFLIKRNDTSEFVKIILSASSFLFGIIIAFSIANRHARLNAIKESFKKQDAALLSLYFLSKTFGKAIIAKTKNKIDRLLISQLDYKLTDISMSAPQKLKELYLFLEKIVPKTEVQREVKEKILDLLEELEEMEKEIDYEIKNRIETYEWVSVYILGGIVLLCLFWINTGTITSVFLVAFLSSALALLLFVLQELENLTWQEESWALRTAIKLFMELDLIPYLPEQILIEQRINLKKFAELKELTRMRIGKFPYPYPNLRGKTVKIVKL